MAAIQVLISVSLPATVLAVRAAKGLLQTVPGEVLGPGAMLLTSFAALGPLCLLSGALFTVGSRMCATGSVYLWEAIGSSAGGIMAALLLVGHWSSLEIALLLAILNLLAAAMPRYTAMAAVAAFAFLLAFSGWPQRWESSSQQRFWRGLPLVATRNSVYGSLAVVGTEGSRSVYENGVVLFNVPDPAAAEEAVHYALLEHPAPRSLLLIGGGLNGSVAQALRHPTLERVDYVELDPAILGSGARLFSRRMARPAGGPARARAHYRRAAVSEDHAIRLRRGDCQPAGTAKRATEPFLYGRFLPRGVAQAHTRRACFPSNCDRRRPT